MIKVITYGTYDMLHYGHIKLLERAKALGDYLIVGVTSDDYDKTRGKINNQQTLMERIAAVEELGIADEVIVEEYEGQKIDDIIKYNIDIFTVGSDWKGKFDYLKEYCEVVYLSRTEGISSTEIRSSMNKLKVGIICDDSDSTSPVKFIRESAYVNGVEITCSNSDIDRIEKIDDLDTLLRKVDAVYIATHPRNHYDDVKKALSAGKHVLCEAPVCLKANEVEELFSIAKKKRLVLMTGIKTAYMTAYERLVLIAKSGQIGKIVSIDATCTSLKPVEKYGEQEVVSNWNTITEWGPIALLPVFQILGTNYKSRQIVSLMLDSDHKFDIFTKADFIFDSAVASIKVGKAVKSEGELVISGTKGYLYVPSPWWKTDYFEARYENPENNKRYFYQLDGEGIRYEIVSFVKAVENQSSISLISEPVSVAIARVMEDFYAENGVSYIN